MSRTKKGKPGPGKEYWSRREFSNHGGATPGRVIKKLTSGKERAKTKIEIRKVLKNES